mmetsp:Transcript_2148/g.8026  ORF Transcript_2148/g.8026 Transcript_2148/m.8026 type:complete len:288 (+) Transcript_2148:2149-3012(+)
MYLHPPVNVESASDATKETSNPTVTERGARPVYLPRVLAGAHSEMYIVHIDVAKPTARPAIKRPMVTCPIVLAVAMSNADTTNPASTIVSAKRRPNDSFKPGVATHPNIAPSGSAATTAPFADVVSVPNTVPDSMYTSAPAMAPHAIPTDNIARQIENVIAYRRCAASSREASKNTLEVNDDDGCRGAAPASALDDDTTTTPRPARVVTAPRTPVVFKHASSFLFPWPRRFEYSTTLPTTTGGDDDDDGRRRRAGTPTDADADGCAVHAIDIAIARRSSSPRSRARW